MGFVGAFSLAWSLLLPYLNEQIYGDRFNDANPVGVAYFGLSFVLAGLFGNNDDHTDRSKSEARLKAETAGLMNPPHEPSSSEMQSDRQGH